MTWLSEMSGMASSGVRSVAQTPTQISAAYASRTMNLFLAESSMIRAIMVVGTTRRRASGFWGVSPGRKPQRPDARRPTSVRFPPQPCLGIQQEPAFDHHVVPRIDARDDHDGLAVASAGRDLTRLVRARLGLDPDELRLAA